MHPFRLALLAAVAVLIAARSSDTGSTGTPSFATPPSPSSAPSASAGARRIEVQLTDALKIEPTQLTMPPGAPVTCVITNAGSTVHESLLGDEAAQDAERAGLAAPPVEAGICELAEAQEVTTP